MLDIRVPNVNERKRIPVEAIQAIVDRIAEKFKPDKIILFGSYAYGDPKPWSDVDLLVVMDTPNGNLAQMLAVSRSLSPHPFGLDIIVHPASVVTGAVAHGDFFLKEIVTRGRVLYEKRHGPVGQQS
jgi:predicted nucleotidyltransferase